MPIDEILSSALGNEQELAHHLSRITGGSYDPHVVNGVLRELGDDFVLRSILQSVQRNATWLTAVGNRSYEHSNGFDKLVLIDEDHLKLRLHIWWPHEQRVTTENIHNHRWHFSSHLVRGGYDFDHFERSAEGLEYEEYQYRSAGGNEEYSLTHVGGARLAKHFSCYMPKGTVYSLSAHSYHRVVADRSVLTASLVLQSSPVREWSEVFVNGGLVDANGLKATRIGSVGVNDRILDFLG